MPARIDDGDEALLAAARDGDRDAFGVLFDRYRDYVFSIAFDILRDEQDACDVTQEAFIKVLTRLHQVHSGARFRGWLARIVVHAAVDVTRRRRRPIVEFDEERHEAAQAVDAIEQHDLHRRVRAAVRVLSPPLRAAVLLRYVAGWSYDRIARRLGVSTGTVASRLSRAHTQVKARIEAEGGRP